MEEEWRLKFIRRTHDLELYRYGQSLDPALYDTVFRRERYNNKRTFKEAADIARTWVIWLAFESLTNSKRLADYN